MDSSIEGPISAADAIGSAETTGREAAAPYEPFLRDWYVPPVERQDAGSLTLTNRQMAIIGFVGILAMGMMAGLAYVAGRVASNGPSRVMMVESAVAAPSSAKVLPSTSSATTLPPVSSADPLTNAEIIQKASPVPPQLPVTDVSLRGLAFWQVGALDPGMAKVSEKYLQDSGVPIRLEAVPGSNQLRVLAGPAEGDELNALKTKLDGLGFQTFLKRY